RGSPHSYLPAGRRAGQLTLRAAPLRVSRGAYDAPGGATSLAESLARRRTILLDRLEAIRLNDRLSETGAERLPTTTREGSHVQIALRDSRRDGGRRD